MRWDARWLWSLADCGDEGESSRRRAHHLRPLFSLGDNQQQQLPSLLLESWEWHHLSGWPNHQGVRFWADVRAVSRGSQSPIESGSRLASASFSHTFHASPPTATLWAPPATTVTPSALSGATAGQTGFAMSLTLIKARGAGLRCLLESYFVADKSRITSQILVQVAYTRAVQVLLAQVHSDLSGMGWISGVPASEQALRPCAVRRPVLTIATLHTVRDRMAISLCPTTSVWRWEHLHGMTGGTCHGSAPPAQGRQGSRSRPRLPVRDQPPVRGTKQWGSGTVRQVISTARTATAVGVGPGFGHGHSGYRGAT
jgi:hypothetical protein